LICSPKKVPVANNRFRTDYTSLELQDALLTSTISTHLFKRSDAIRIVGKRNFGYIKLMHSCSNELCYSKISNPKMSSKLIMSNECSSLSITDDSITSYTRVTKQDQRRLHNRWAKASRPAPAWARVKGTIIRSFRGPILFVRCTRANRSASASSLSSVATQLAWSSFGIAAGSASRSNCTLPKCRIAAHV
jgi:hypothetical protein